MSIEARQELVADPYLFFASSVTDPQNIKNDLLDPDVTSTGMIALLIELVKIYPIELTVAKSGHHDDSALGPMSHGRGCAFDCWPLASAHLDDWLDAKDERFRAFLEFCENNSWTGQIGLAGTAITPENMAAAIGQRDPASGFAFEDSGADHVHIGIRP